jgi:hypothetical protein
MRKQIQDLIPAATAAVRACLLDEKHKPLEAVNEAYGGYAAAYGSTIDQCGLLAATAMYCDLSKTSSTKANKTYLMDAIWFVLCADKKNPQFDAFDRAPRTPAQAGEKRASTFFRYVQAQHEDRDRTYALKRQVLDAAVALKLVIRTFTQFKPDTHATAS